MQIHLLKVDININHVQISIRFPGQLSFQLKNPHLYQDIQKMFPLTNGECKVNQTISFETEATYNVVAQKYSEVAVDLVISINTSSGKIIAGTVNFNAADNNKNRVFSIRRCCDKRAVIQMSVSFIKIKKVRDVDMEINSEKAPLKTSNKMATSPIHDISSPSLNINISQVNYSKVEGQKDREQSKSSEKLRQLLSSRSKNPKNTGLNQRYKQLQESNNYRLKIVSKEKQEIENQLQQTKQRYRNTQRREKQLQITIKQLKDGNEKKRLRILDLQSKQGQYERLTLQNQKRIRQLHQDLKAAKENTEQAFSRNSLLEKRLETREQTAIEKQKRYTEKIGHLEAQHTKTTHQYNILLQRMEYQQKNHQNILKTKERTFLQEKLKLKEQLDILDKNYKLLTEQNSDFLTRNTAISELQKKLQIRISQLQNQLQNKTSSLLSLTSQLDRQQKNRAELQRQILNFKELQIEKSNLKKKLTQQNQEGQKTKDKLDKLTLQYQELKENYNQQETALEQHRKDKKFLQTKFIQLEKQYNIFEKQVSRLQLQNNGLSSKNSLLTERTNDIKTKFDQLQREFSEKQTNYLSKLNSIAQSKQYVISEVQDLKWALQKQKENVSQAQKKLRQKNQKILQQEEVILNLDNQVAQGKIKFEAYQQTITNLQAEITEFRRKERQFLDINKQHEKKQFELNKKIAEIEQENFIQLDKIQKNNNEQLQTIEGLQNTFQQLKTQLQNKNNSLQSLQQNFDKLTDDYSDLERQFKLQTMSLDQTDRMNLSNHQRYLSLKKTYDDLKKQLEQAHDSYGKQYQKITIELKDMKQKYEQGQKNIRVATANIQNYKKAVQQLFIIISSDDEDIKSDQIFTVPDVQLSKIQIEALGSRAKCLSNLKETNIEQQVEINYLQKENEMKSKSLQAKTQELQKTILQYNNKISQIQAKFDAERRQFEEKIQKLEVEVGQVKFQKQKLQNKVKSLSQLYEEQKASKVEAEQLYQNAQQSIKQLDLKLIQGKSRQTSLKNQDQNLIHNLKVTLIGQIQASKEKINTFLKQKQTVQKLSAEKDKNIQTLKAKIAEQVITIQKLEINISKSNEENKSLLALKIDLQQNLRQKQTKITTATQKMQKMAAEIKSLNELNNQLTNKLKHAHTEISQLSVKIQSLQNKLSSNHTSFSSTTEEQKARISTLQENLVQQTKKSNKLFDQLSQKSNSLQMKVFEVQQLELKLQSSQKTILQLRNENQDKRKQINKLDQTLQSLKRKIFGVEKQKNDHSQEKDIILEELDNRKQEILSLQKEIKDLKSDIQELQNQLKIQQNKYEELNKQKCNLSNLNFQMKEMLGQAKKQMQRANARQSQTKSRLSTVQEQLKQKEQYYMLYKNKTQVETQRQISQLKNKIRKMQARFKDAEKMWATQKEELKFNLQSSYNEKDQLEVMLEEREQLIQKQEAEILEEQKKIITLSTQLRGILQAWEIQKNATKSSKIQENKIEEQDLGLFQNLAYDLQDQRKEVLSPFLVVQQEKNDEISKDYDILKAVHQKMLQSQKAA